MFLTVVVDRPYNDLSTTVERYDYNADDNRIGGSAMSERAMVVFTFRPQEQIFLERGSQAWALKPANARRCNYIVCTRNRHFADEPAVQAAILEEHGAAFLIGRITAVEQSPERDDRYIVRFEEFAVLDPQPVIWPGHRNPVWYVEDIRTLGIDPDKLNWQPMPAAVPVTVQTAERKTEMPEGLMFDQARAGLAITYKVPPANIEIVIRG